MRDMLLHIVQNIQWEMKISYLLCCILLIANRQRDMYFFLDISHDISMWNVCVSINSAPTLFRNRKTDQHYKISRYN